MKQIAAFVTAFYLMCQVPISITAQSKIHGLITDTSNKPVVGVTVLLLNPNDSSLVKGTVTSNTGNYFFNGINPGQYFINVSGIGFLPVGSSVFEVLPGNSDIDKGAIQVRHEHLSLSHVTVVAKKPLYEQKPDRLVINVTSSIMAPGYTALQVLERSPGVTVNRQNNMISILGKNGVQIMVNGKISYMPISAIVQMLDGMNAANIEKIELITTPPSNLDAEGNAGYINIVLKTNDNIGTNGSYTATLGYGKGWAPQGSLNFNHRKGKINLFGDLSYTWKQNPFPLSSYDRISNSGNIYETYSNVDRSEITRQHNIRLGLDYQASKNTVMGFLITSNGRWYTQNEQTTTLYNLNGLLDTLAKSANSELNNWQDYSINLNLQQSFKKGDNLAFNITYLHYKNNQPFNYYTNYYDPLGSFVYNETIRTGKLTPMNFWIGAIDYNKKLSKKASMETGVKSTFASFTNDLSYELFNQGIWTKDPSLSALYTLKENYLAAYISFNINPSDKTSIKGGLRYEYTNSNLGTESQKNMVDRHYGKLFPTLSFSQKLGEKSNLNFAYSVRITRPTFNDLAPFTYFTNRNTRITGNPALQPAISHAVSAGYSFKSYLLQVSFTKEDNSITGFQPSIDSVANKITNSPENLDNQKLISVMLGLPFSIAKWWNIQCNITGVWQQVNARYKNEPIRLEGKNINIFLVQNFMLPKDYSIELTGFYQSKNMDGISILKSMSNLDFGIRKKLDEKNALNFSASNLFNSMDIRGYTDLPEQNLVNTIYIRFMWRTFKLSYIHNFGKQKLQANRNRSTGAEDVKGRVQY